jgi:hypothetical protein
MHAKLPCEEKFAITMSVDQFELIRRLKQTAMERCRERAVYARSVSKRGDCREPIPSQSQKELLRRWKLHHGL